MEQAYPFAFHPCWSDSRAQIWERIHLPVAASCNVKCAFCDGRQVSSCYTPIPGSSQSIMSPRDAVSRTLEEMDRRPNLRIVAVSGPGDPLANWQTFDVLDAIKEARPKTRFCLCTNGILLSQSLERIRRVGVETVSVSISTVNPSTAAHIYEWAIIDGKMLSGVEMGREVVGRQLRGIIDAGRIGIHVKANTILMPGINDTEIAEIAKHLADNGAALQNIVPLIPNANMRNLQKPVKSVIENARTIAAQYIRQFHHCQQCRSDVVGIPGMDTIL